MHIIYHCVGGTHSSAIASAVHLCILPRNRVATDREILSIPYYDNISVEQYGRIIHRGIDEYGNNIYTLSRQFSGNIIIRALKDLSLILAKDETRMVFVNVSPAVNTIMKIGGFLSRKLHMVTLGRPIVLWGSRRAYMDIVGIVNRTREKVQLKQNP
ncbi:MAG: DUF3189 family protein [Firmicutes bacterium]|nr:DUF3189 family protein [Bacillota bacterium]MDD3851736.1 DUF3189 family protein [Bacillota bacterium]MDD4708364.1 DUF3189 family protein [Bacillota bacterium]